MKDQQNTNEQAENRLTKSSSERGFWSRFRANRLGYWSFCILVILTVLSLGAEVISNDRPLVVRYAGTLYFPIVQDLPETVFGGDFETPTDFHDPFIHERLSQEGNWAIYTPNRYGFKTLNYFEALPNPAPPSQHNWLGTDRQGRDMVALLIYGFRVSMMFAIVLTIIGAVLGMLAGAVQGYFAGKVDLVGQRLIEIWAAMPVLYLLIILSSIFKPSIVILVVLLSLFSWIGLSAYVRAEFLRNRQLDYVRSARALGLGHGQIIWRHILPNSMMPVITLLPFMMSGAMVTLTSLDFLGLGVPPETSSLGALLQQGKRSLDAWWISLPTFGVLFVTLMLLTFTGDGLRNALDPRYRVSKKKAGEQE